MSEIRAARSSEPMTDAAAWVSAVRALDLALERLRATIAHEHRITVGDTLVISLLVAHPTPLTPTELASRLAVTTGTFTAMLDRLEAAGLVIRTPNPRDRRSVLIELTPAGRAGLAYGETIIADAAERAVPPELREAMLASLVGIGTAIHDQS